MDISSKMLPTDLEILYNEDPNFKRIEKSRNELIQFRNGVKKRPSLSGEERNQKAKQLIYLNNEIAVMYKELEVIKNKILQSRKITQ